jgi:hypothetical protein
VADIHARHDHIGHAWPAFEVLVERTMALNFARGLDETRPVYLERDAAVAAGFRDVLTLPTFPIAKSTRPGSCTPASASCTISRSASVIS